MPDPRSMHAITEAILADYLAQDRIGALLAERDAPGDAGLTCQRWLLSTPPKRYSAAVLYGDLLERKGLRILDVGGGLTGITRLLAERHDYTLIDLMAHDGEEAVAAFRASCAPFRLFTEDWAKAFPDESFDVVIAADLFPNVDQRLDSFLRRATSCAGETRLSLTWHDPPRQDLVRRVHGDEIMCMVGWSGKQILQLIADYKASVVGYTTSFFEHPPSSVYSNGRHVAFVTINRKCMSEHNAQP